MTVKYRKRPLAVKPNWASGWIGLTKAVYNGGIITSDGRELKGKIAYIKAANAELQTVHARFVDADAERYNQKWHWFFRSDFCVIEGK